MPQILMATMAMTSRAIATMIRYTRAVSTIGFFLGRIQIRNANTELSVMASSASARSAYGTRSPVSTRPTTRVPSAIQTCVALTSERFSHP